MLSEFFRRGVLPYFVVDYFPFVGVLARCLFPHSNKTSDVFRPSRFTGLRDFFEMALGVLQVPNLLRTLLLSRTGTERPCGQHPNKRNEIASLHFCPNFGSDTIPRW